MPVVEADSRSWAACDYLGSDGYAIEITVCSGTGVGTGSGRTTTTIAYTEIILL